MSSINASTTGVSPASRPRAELSYEWFLFVLSSIYCSTDFGSGDPLSGSLQIESLQSESLQSRDRLLNWGPIHHMGVYSLGVHRLGVSSRRVHNLERPIFLIWDPHTWVSPTWEHTVFEYMVWWFEVSSERFLIRGPTHLGVYSLGIYRLRVYSLATDFGSGDPFI